jgi:hypothetical protein
MKPMQPRRAQFSSPLCVPTQKLLQSRSSVNPKSNFAYILMSLPFLIAGLGLAWVAEMVFELLIFILIVYRICKTKGLLRLSLVTRKNIIDIIFHDGNFSVCI